MKHTTQLLVLLLAMLAPIGALAQQTTGNNTKEFETQTTSGLTGTLTFKDALGTKTNTFEMTVTGGPATVAVTISGCMRGGTCQALTTSSSTSNTNLGTSGGPFDNYQIAYTLTGGASPALTFNRTATVAGLANPLNPANSGGPGTAAACNVDKSTHPTLISCVNEKIAQGLQGGVINEPVPEDFTVNPTSAKNSWSVYLGVGTTGTTCTSVPCGAWSLEVPWVIPAGMDIYGQGIVLAASSYTSGTPITYGPSFPAPLLAPSTPTVGCAGSGTIATGIQVFAGTVMTRDLQFGNGATPVPGPTVMSAEQNCTTAGASAGVTVTAPNVAGSGAGIAQDFYVCASLVSGQEVCGISGVNVTCPDGAGVLDPNACKLVAGNHVATLTAVPQGFSSGSNADSSITPPLSDLTNPLIVVGHGNNAQISFGQFLSGFTLVCSPGNSDTPTANAPNVAIWMRNNEESSLVDRIGASGACGGYTVAQAGSGAYIYFTGTNGDFSHFNSGKGPNVGQFSAMIADGAYSFISQQIGIHNSTFNVRTGGETSLASLLVSGPKTFVTCTACHLENTQGGDAILVQNQAHATVIGGQGIASNHYMVHRKVGTAGIFVSGMPNGDTSGLGVVLDDARGVSITQEVSSPAGYDSKNYIAKQEITVPYTNAATTTFSSVLPTGFGLEPSPLPQWHASVAEILKYRLIDSNGNIEQVTTSGTTNTTVPAWNTTVGGTTADNTITWTNEGSGTYDYDIICDGYYQGSATTAVPSIKVTGPASAITAKFSEDATLTSGSNPTFFSQTASGFGSSLTPAAIVTTATDMPLHIHSTIRNGLVQGTWQLQARPNGAGTLTIEPGFACIQVPMLQQP